CLDTKMPRMKNTLILVLVLLLFQFASAQGATQPTQNKIDSLKTILSKKSSSDTLTVNQMNTLSHLLARDRELESASEYVQKPKKLATKLGVKEAEANAYNIIGIIAAYKSDYLEALKNFSESLKLWKEIGNKQGISNAYNHIGSIYESQGNYPE